MISNTGGTPGTSGPNWFTTAEGEALRAHHVEIAGAQLRGLFADDPDRANSMTLAVADLTLDF